MGKYGEMDGKPYKTKDLNVINYKASGIAVINESKLINEKI